MTDSNQQTPFNDDFHMNEIDLRELFKTLFKAKLLIILITFISGISSIFYSLSLTNYYQSESVMSFRNSSDNQGVLSQFSGAASLMGLNLSSSGDNRSQQVIQLIQSRKFVKHLLTFDDVLPSIMAAKSYDTASKKLILDTKIYDSETNTWKGESRDGGPAEPSYLDVYGVYIEDLVSVTLDTGSGFVVMSVEHQSPYFAKYFLELIITEANSFLRNKDLEESSQALEYLQSQLAKVSLVELKESINTIIENQLEIQMLAKINEDYILVEIDPPYVPEKTISNSKTLIVIFSTLLGGLIGCLIALGRDYFNRMKKVKTI
jgi:LPS O-antigen subunit length determinant protein (WzzB/FepE family)